MQLSLNRIQVILQAMPFCDFLKIVFRCLAFVYENRIILTSDLTKSWIMCFHLYFSNQQETQFNSAKMADTTLLHPHEYQDAWNEIIAIQPFEIDQVGYTNLIQCFYTNMLILTYQICHWKT